MTIKEIIVSDDNRQDARDIIIDSIRRGFLKDEKGWMAIVENISTDSSREEFEVNVIKNGKSHFFHITCEYRGSCDGE